MDWQILVAFAVPVLGFLGAVSTGNRDPGSYRRLKHATDALASAPANTTARNALDELVSEQSRGLLAREQLRNSRKLNPFNLVISITLAVAGAFGSFWLWNWSASVWGTGLAWLVLPLSIVIGLMIVLLVGASFTTIFAPRTAKRDRG